MYNFQLVSFIITIFLAGLSIFLSIFYYYKSKREHNFFINILNQLSQTIDLITTLEYISIAKIQNKSIEEIAEALEQDKSKVLRYFKNRNIEIREEILHELPNILKQIIGKNEKQKNFYVKRFKELKNLIMKNPSRLYKS